MRKAVSLWACGFAVVAGFLYYHSAVPLGPLLIAGLLTLIITVVKAKKPK